MPRNRLSAQQQAIRRGAKTDPNRKVLYRTHPGPQTRFLETDAEEALYGGAMGGGKSFSLRAWGVNYCFMYPGAQIVLFRRSYRELEDTHILAVQQEVPNSVASYSSKSHTLIFANGSIFQFRYCEQNEDVRTYFTSEYDAMLFDEITEFTQYQYVNLITRCRSTKPWWPGRRIRAGGMPLGVGHVWCKSRWVDPALPNTVWKAPVSEGGLTRVFIPARVQDNPSLMKADPNYIDMLRGLPYEEYRARALGDWDVFMGQFFSRWRHDIHVLKPFDIPPDWDKFLCVDYGFNVPYAALWFARPPGTQSAYFYREQYGKGFKLDEQVYRAHQAVVTASETLRAIVLDPAMFGKVNVKGEQIEAMAAEWQKMFGATATVLRGNNERVPGWRLMREMIDWAEKPDGGILTPPRLFVFDTCPNLVRTIPLLVTDEHNVEDVDSDGEDHAPDAARYGLRHAFSGAGRRGIQREYAIGPGGIVTR